MVPEGLLRPASVAMSDTCVPAGPPADAWGVMVGVAATKFTTCSRSAVVMHARALALDRDARADDSVAAADLLAWPVAKFMMIAVWLGASVNWYRQNGLS